MTTEKKNNNPQLFAVPPWPIPRPVVGGNPRALPLSDACWDAQAGQNILPPRSKLHLSQSQLPHSLQVFTPFSSG